jgi:hypothetical protein
MYDFFVKTYDVPSNVPQVETPKQTYRMYQTETALIVYADDVKTLKLYNLNGSIVSQSFMSQIVNTTGLSSGVYLVEIETNNGNRTVQKFIRK